MGIWGTVLYFAVAITIGVLFVILRPIFYNTIAYILTDKSERGSYREAIKVKEKTDLSAWIHDDFSND